MKKIQTNTLENVVIDDSINKYIKSENSFFTNATQEKMNEILNKSIPSLEKCLKKYEKK